MSRSKSPKVPVIETRLAWLGSLLCHLHHYLVKVPQRMPFQVLLGLLLILSSHFASSTEAAWLRDTGTAICTFSISRWLAQQGRRRQTPEGAPLRNPTLRFRLPPRDDEHT